MTEVAAPPRIRNPERKERILAAAADLIARNGYHSVSMAEIGAAARITAGRSTGTSIASWRWSLRCSPGHRRLLEEFSGLAERCGGDPASAGRLAMLARAVVVELRLA
jgi:hypothetical protein